MVKGPAEEHLNLENDDEDLGHGCKIMLHLLRYWSSTKCRIVCADSYYASVQAARRLFDLKHLVYWSDQNSNEVISQGIFGEGGVAHSWDCGGIDGSS
jgi:hypothetical protein